MTAHQTVRQRNHKLRIVSWILFYGLIFSMFLAVIYWQSNNVNTLEFPTGVLQLTTSKQKYIVGDIVSYTIKNGLSTAVKYVNKCPKEPLHVYQWESNQWVRIHNQANKSTCLNQPTQITIQPNSSLTKNFAAWKNLFSKPGIYRVVAFADNYTALPYADFQVIDKASPPQKPLIIYKPVYTPVYTPIYVPSAPPTDN